MTENVAVLFDIQNLYHSSKIYGGSKINYKLLLEKIKENRNVLSAKAYAAHKDGKNANAFYKALKSSGIDVLSKKVQVKNDGSNNTSKVIPVHFDVEITTDAIFYPRDTTTIILCSGNGNFAYMVKELVKEGINVEIWSFKESTSENLISSATKFVQIPQGCLLANPAKDEE